MPLLVKDDVHQGRLIESLRCHRGEGDDGQSEPVLKLPLHQGASRAVQIVSIGLHFYFGHSDASSAASELNVCHADSPNGKSDYGFHPAAPCISFQISGADGGADVKDSCSLQITHTHLLIACL